MALGTALAIGATVAGGALASSSANKGANKAADTSLAVAEKNNALTRDIYNQNQQTLSPFVNNGVTAGNYLNAFLGLPTQATSIGSAAGTDWAAYVNGNPDALANWNAIKNTSSGKQFGGDIAAFGKYHYGEDGSRRDVGQYGGGVTTTPAVTQADAQNAFGNYIKGSDYGFQFATGSNAVNSGYAGSGSLQSGAAMKALEQYRQNLQAGYRNEYTGQLANQQGVGLGAASALAGVGQNYAASVGANNTAAGNASANAALIKGQNNPFANALSTLGGGLLGIGG